MVRIWISYTQLFSRKNFEDTSDIKMESFFCLARPAMPVRIKHQSEHQRGVQLSEDPYRVLGTVHELHARGGKS